MEIEIVAEGTGEDLGWHDPDEHRAISGWFPLQPAYLCSV